MKKNITRVRSGRRSVKQSGVVGNAASVAQTSETVTVEIQALDAKLEQTARTEYPETRLL